MIQLTKISLLVFFSILAVCLIIMTWCKKDDDDKKNEETAEFSYKVNGVEFKSDVKNSGYDTTSDGSQKCTLVARSNTDTSKLITLDF